jgi:hypothetical protein
MGVLLIKNLKFKIKNWGGKARGFSKKYIKSGAATFFNLKNPARILSLILHFTFPARGAR